MSERNEGGEQATIEVDKTEDEGTEPAESKIGLLKKWSRAIVVVLVVILMAVVHPTYGGRAAGTALGLALLWFVIGAIRKSWIRGYSGLWLYVVGLVLVAFSAVLPGNSSGNMGFAIGIATIVVAVAWVAAKIWATGEGRDNWSES